MIPAGRHRRIDRARDECRDGSAGSMRDVVRRKQRPKLRKDDRAPLYAARLDSPIV